ncbi:PREDICTED: uncharacterized protein LOC104073819, partial [Fulmarus glacialis]|uniref:uncharacterized protein LOC104073819 n=1 Tax=Fulmarus glacialis TaxID=30455 RepID=UPI00051B7094
MGKKSRVKTQKSGTGATATVSPKEMLNLISELLQKCSSPTPGPGKEWEEYVQIRSLVEKIRKKQKGLSVVFDGKRDDYFPELVKWATENGASTEGFEIANFEEEGFGLKATREIKAEELFLWVPRKLLMTVESAKNSVLGSLYSQDRILQAMGNITLAFHLLCERANPNSFWLPYIQTLPSEYDTPLYFEEDEVQYLQSTQAIHDVFSQYKNTARQYAYFYKVIQVSILYLLFHVEREHESRSVLLLLYHKRFNESVLCDQDFDIASGTRGSHIVYRHSQSDYIPKENTTKFEPFLKEYAVVFVFDFQWHLRASVVYSRDIFVDRNKTRSAFGEGTRRQLWALSQPDTGGGVWLFGQRLLLKQLFPISSKKKVAGHMEASCGPDSADGRQLDRAGLDRNTGTSHLVSAISYTVLCELRLDGFHIGQSLRFTNGEAYSTFGGIQNLCPRFMFGKREESRKAQRGKTGVIYLHTWGLSPAINLSDPQFEVRQHSFTLE